MQILWGNLMDTISAIVVEDKAVIDRCLTPRLTAFENINVLAHCDNQKCGYSYILDYQPDVVFVDIEMLGASGIELLDKLNGAIVPLPKIVFVAASSEFAMQAFEYKVFDYLLKPISNCRLKACLDRLGNALLENQALLAQTKLNQLLCSKTGKSLDGFMQCLEHSKQATLTDLQQTISIKSGTQWLRIKLENILWIEAAGDYMCIHTLDETHIVRKTLRQFEAELDKRCFPRINRSSIINLNQITHLTPNSNGEYMARLVSGVELKVSRKYKLKLSALNLN